MDQALSHVARRRRRRGQSGFTLIELLVVIAVLAVLAAIVIFNVTGVTNRGNSAACQTDTKTVQTAVDAYYNDAHGTGNTTVYPVTGADTASPAANAGVNTDELVSNNYLHSAPTTTGALTYPTAGSGTIKAANC